jgi:ABC-2 type transport system ATP-binding protein
MNWGARDVRVAFGTTVALDGVDLVLRPGAMTAVVGGDGAGKTTLLRTLVQLVPVSSGAVETPARHRIGYMPSSSGTYPDLTVTENLKFAATAYDVPASVATDHMVSLIDAAGLDELERPGAGAAGRPPKPRQPHHCGRRSKGRRSSRY